MKVFIQIVTLLLTLQKLKGESVDIYKINSTTKEKIFTLNFTTEKHHCQERISYNLTSGSYCEFTPSYEEQFEFLKTADNHGHFYNLEKHWEKFLNSSIGSSVGQYILNGSKKLNESLAKTIHNLWFHHPSRMRNDKVDVTTAFHQVFLGKYSTSKNSTERKGFKSWAGYTHRTQNMNKNIMKDVTHLPIKEESCGESQLKFMSINYTTDDCNNRVTGTMIPGVSFYFDLAVFTVAAHNLLKTPEVGMEVYETTYPNSSQCNLQFIVKSRRLNNGDKIYLEYAQYENFQSLFDMTLKLSGF